MHLFLKILVACACLYAAVKFSGDGGIRDNIDTVGSVTWTDWIGLAVLTLLGFWLLSLMFRISLHISRCHIPHSLSFRLTVLNNFLNTFLPMKGGLIVRGAYLKNHFNFQWKDYALVILFSQFLNVALLFLLLFIASLDAFSLSLDRIRLSLGDYIGAALAIVVLSASISFAFRAKIYRVVRYMYISAGYWFSNVRATLKYLISSTTFHLVSAARLWLSFALVGSVIPIADITAIYCIMALGMSVAFTPGNIGVKELSIVFIAGFFSIDSELALNAAIVDRVAGLTMTFLIGGPFTLTFLKKEKQMHGSS
jgi:uncharacterized membrane protein YbhN (UPF0104 family)